MVHKMATTSPIEPCDRLQEEASSPRREEATTPTRSHSNTNKSTAAKCKCNQLKCNRRRQLRADVKTNKIKFLMLITAALVLLQSFTARAAQGLLQLQASERLEAGHRPARAAASSQMGKVSIKTEKKVRLSCVSCLPFKSRLKSLET